jgi:hypothetical protein
VVGPCSFSTQNIDLSQDHPQLEEIVVKVGASRDEHDGSAGNSATQKTTVHPLTVGTSKIRLIDTPGIGDTRGGGVDRRNMDDILSTLSSYDELHQILILIKSTTSRLTRSFVLSI